MADKRIKYEIEIDISRVETALRGALKSHEANAKALAKQYISLQKELEQANERSLKNQLQNAVANNKAVIKEEKEKNKALEKLAKEAAKELDKENKLLNREIKKSNDEQIKEFNRQKKLQVASEVKAAKEIEKINKQLNKELEHDRLNTLKERFAKRDQEVNFLGHLAGAAGNYRGRHLLQSGSALAGEEASVGTVLGAAAGVGGALAVVAAAALAVSAVFEVLKSSTMDMVNAVTSLGGARNIEGMFVESVSNDKLVRQARFQVSGNERMSSESLNALSNNLSENPAAGAFSKEEWLKSIRGIGTLSGKQASLQKKDLEFLGGLSLVTGSSLEDTTKIFGGIQAKNPEMSSKQVISAMLAGHAIGQSGSFDIGEVEHAGKLMQLTSRIGGESDTEKLSSLFTVGTLLKPTVGNMNIAGVQLHAFLQQAGKTNSSMFNFKEGQLTNFNQAMENVVNTPMANLPHQLMTGRSGEFLTNMKESVSQRAGVDIGDFSQTAIDARTKVIEDFNNLHMSMDQFNKEVNDSTGPQERFKSAFNKIADQLEGPFYTIMDDLSQPGGAVDTFSKSITDHTKEIEFFFTFLAKVLEAFASKIFPLIEKMGTDLVDMVFPGLGTAGAQGLHNYIDKQIGSEPSAHTLAQTNIVGHATPHAVTPPAAPSASSFNGLSPEFIASLNKAAENLRQAAEEHKRAMREQRTSGTGTTHPSD